MHYSKYFRKRVPREDDTADQSTDSVQSAEAAALESERDILSPTHSPDSGASSSHTGASEQSALATGPSIEQYREQCSDQ